ncbi:MAG: EAL domain-containing protein [Acidimicrobiia bacterium]
MTAKPTRVLYVDDDPDDHAIIRDHLSEADGDFELDCMTTYDAALGRLLSPDHNVCLLDHQLNDRTGFDVLRATVAYDDRVPIIILTGRGCRALDIQAAELGAVDYLVKEHLNWQILERTIRYAVHTARATMELRESDERYVLAARGANDGLWDWNLATNILTLSPRWMSIFGYPKIANHPKQWMRRVHPDDLKEVEAAITAHVRGKTDFLNTMHRMLHADGTYRWVLVRASAERAGNGEAYRIAGSHMDITKLRNTEALLLERSLYDEPTGLPNRKLLVARAGEAASAAASLTVAVNCSTRHFVDPGVVAWISATVEAAGVDGSHLILEMTESALLEDSEVTIGILDEFTALGVSAVIDDFGTGFSALSYLHRLPLSALKIDRSFVSALTPHNGTADIARSIIGLARNLGFSVIAEGVEHQTQLRDLQRTGCDAAPGFHLGRPLDPSGAKALIAERKAILTAGYVSSDEARPDSKPASSGATVDVSTVPSSVGMG